MVQYTESTVNKNVIAHIFCNLCGKEIERADKQYFKDHVHIDKTWGYFSNKDGKKQSYDICESCHDEFIKTFKIPIE